MFSTFRISRPLYGIFCLAEESLSFQDNNVYVELVSSYFGVDFLFASWLNYHLLVRILSSWLFKQFLFKTSK